MTYFLKTTLITAVLMGGVSTAVMAQDLPSFKERPVGTPSATTATTYEEKVAELKAKADITKFVKVRMRDGVALSTDIYLPKNAKGKVPTILWKTPYNYNKLGNTQHMFALDAINNGYAFVVQNERGKFFSEGEWEILGFPQTDGYDGLTWIADQEWSNGKVGTIGCSSSAEWMMALAAQDHPAHAAMVPMAMGAGIGRVGEFYEQGNWYTGGVPAMFYLPWLYGVQNTQRPTFPKDMSREDLERLSAYFDLAPKMPRVEWKKEIDGLPYQDLMEKVNGPKGIWADYSSRGPDHPDWYKGGLYHDNMDFGVPSLWFNSWYDVSISPNLALYNHARKNASDKFVRDNQYVVVAPSAHCGYYRMTNPLVVGERNVGNPQIDLEKVVYDFFDMLMKDDGTDKFRKENPRVQYYAMGENKWKGANQWPPEGSKPVTYYLTSGGKANSMLGDGVLTTVKPPKMIIDNFTYDPNNPTPSLGGGVCCIGGAVNGGSYDQRPVEMRNDVLVYTSEPMSKDTEVSGSVRVTLYLHSDVKDTDLSVKLVDVAPDGTAYNLHETMQRVRYREGYDKEVFMEKGKVYKVELTAMSTANVFKKGHRIRIDIAGSNFPQYSRNLNTGGSNYNESKGVKANNGLHHGSVHASKVVLPIVMD